MTLPRELRIVDGALVQTPIAEIATFYKPVVVYEDVTLKQETARYYQISGEIGILDLEADLKGCETVSIMLRNYNEENTVLAYNTNTAELILDRSNSGLNITGEEDRQVFSRKVKVPLDDNVLRLQVFLDVSSVEILVNDGKESLTATIYPTKKPSDLISFQVKGTIAFKRLAFSDILVEVPTEKRVRRWALSMEELVSDPTGLQEFTNYLRKEYSHENIRFWMAVNDLRRSAQSQILWKVQEIFEEFLAPGAPCEINIDGKTMEKVHQEMKTPSRFTFDAAQEHVYTLLLKKRLFIRSEYYKNLLATGIQPSQKKRFFGFGQTKKKASTSTAPNQQLLQQQASQGTVVMCGALSKRRGSDRSLSGSAHELAVSGVKDPKVPHSHSQSNLSDIPYRGDLACIQKAPAATAPSPVKKPSIAIVAGASTSEDVCPWEAAPPEPRSRKNSTQLDSGSSSSDISVAVAEVAEKVQRSCVLTQQHTVDEGRKLSANICEAPRRASVSVPIMHSTGEGAKRKVSSFEDNSSAATSTSSSVLVIPSDTDNKPEEKPSTAKTLKKNHSLAKTTPSSVAPIISVSSVVDDSPSDRKEAKEEEATAEKGGDREKKIEEVACCSQEPLAPLAEPDSESPASEFPPSEPGEAEAEGEAKSNDVCPWEDE
ncbi:hypothetical protein NQ315_003744 [Exocentrus adspersus]|uniref:RGS domain-containing protein n=1 Tax=Exocentrus adspersus TaxID=1586481 RepID=A0AAV8VIL9_9CUCU|nr:hypothetical protein NQ315_003744 [Exocentrus adspersus]